VNILGTSAVGGGRENGGRAPAAGRRKAKLSVLSMIEMQLPFGGAWEALT
jgi:hypothetical protein